jgi:hypothetical protein
MSVLLKQTSFKDSGFFISNIPKNGNKKFWVLFVKKTFIFKKKKKKF